MNHTTHQHWGPDLRTADQEQPRRRRSALLTRLDEVSVTVAARAGVTPRAVLGMVIVLIAVVGVLGARVLMARASARPQPVGVVTAPSTPPTRVSSTDPAGATQPSPDPGAAQPSTDPSVLMVHVVGMVRHPGVVTVPAGARVEDAVAAAGGLTSAADPAGINLARLVVDGEQIVVPRPGQVVPPAPAPPAGSAAGSTGAAGPSAPVNINTANAQQLDALPGVGPVLAGRIVDYRTEHGRFRSVDELAEVKGIGDAVLQRLRGSVRL